MFGLTKVVAVGTILALVAGWLWRRWRRVQQSAQQQLAMLEFADDRGKLETMFLTAAAATGKPRGLSWKKCVLGDDPHFAKDRVNGEFFALVGVTISFEAIEGGDMEDVEAVGNLRFATAVFVYRQRKWTTEGRVVFNLEPAQALQYFQESLLPIALLDTSSASSA